MTIPIDARDGVAQLRQSLLSRSETRERVRSTLQACSPSCLALTSALGVRSRPSQPPHRIRAHADTPRRWSLRAALATTTVRAQAVGLAGDVVSQQALIACLSERLWCEHVHPSRHRAPSSSEASASPPRAGLSTACCFPMARDCSLNARDCAEACLQVRSKRARSGPLVHGHRWGP